MRPWGPGGPDSDCASLAKKRVRRNGKQMSKRAHNNSLYSFSLSLTLYIYNIIPFPEKNGEKRHHIWSGPLSNMPPEVHEAAEECRRMHEGYGWTYMFWDDKKIRALPGMPYLPEMMADPKLVRHYVDTVRLYLLHRFGGVYLDVDAYCLRAFDPLLRYMEEERADFLAGYESERMRGSQIANGIQIAAPASPSIAANILHLGIKLHKKKVWKERKAGTYTGPRCTTEVREQWGSWVSSGRQIILSSAAFIPLYKDEGKHLRLDDVFDIANGMGSYTVQMYQHTKQASMYKMIERENNRTSDMSEKTNSRLSIEQISEEARERGAGSDGTGDGQFFLGQSRESMRSILMVVAHPDDEILWGGEFLIREGWRSHVVVTSTLNKDTQTRLGEFRSVASRLDFHGEFLDGKDTSRPKGGLEERVRIRIRDLVCDRGWEKIITHGPEGEYGHRQHQLVHDAVLDAVRSCCGSAERLYVFEPHLSPDGSSKGGAVVFSKDKAEVAKLYRSQEKVIFDNFGNWSEKIVPFEQYNYKSASEDCMAAAAEPGAGKSRRCRLHETLNFTSLHYRSGLLLGTYNGQGNGC